MGMKKGHSQSNCGGGGGSGGELINKYKKMVIVLVVILVGIMGVMVVQKVKDRKMFNLVVKDKDRQILSLHLLLQKERQFVKENKRKNQDLNAKLFSLRTQKVELDNKIMEMRSTIGSMKDEQRALELAIDERHNEIKHQESEIKYLRSRLQSPPKIWSVSSDDPSNHEVNSTGKIITSRVTSWFGRSGNVQKPNQETVLNPEAKVQKPKDSNDDAKIQMRNSTGTPGSEETENGLSIKGRKFLIGASESQRVKDERHAIGSTNQTDAQYDNRQLNTNWKGPLEVTRYGKRSIDQDTEREAERTDEDDDEADADRDMKSSMKPNKGSEEDQEYKEETD